MTLVGTALNLREKMKIYRRVLMFFIKRQIWLFFYVVVLQTTAKKWTKVKNARAGLAKLMNIPESGLFADFVLSEKNIPVFRGKIK